MGSESGQHYEIVIVGAGFSGIGTAISLLKAGFADFLIVDDADGVGGTWHWNTYPGIAVDIPSYSYQFSYEMRTSWSRTYAHGDELKAYAERCVEKYGLQNYIRFNTTVDEACFDEGAALWRLSCSSGQNLTARFVINCSGVLSRPKWPDIPGVRDFAGVTLHTARWDHTKDLTGKRVAVIGTGASAVQLIPEVAKIASSLTVFQRTPIYCLPKPDFSIPSWAATVMRLVPGAQLMTRTASQAFVEFTFPIAAHFHSLIPVSDLMEEAAKRYMRRAVDDPVTRDQLIPRYSLGCKRPSFHNSYLATYNRRNVSLETSGITHVDHASVHTEDGKNYPIDVMVLATGFKVMESGNMPTYVLKGRGGVEQSAWWDEHRLQAFEGVSVPGFPNHFNIFGPYGYNGSSYFTLIEAQSRHIVRCLRRARTLKADYVEVRQQANDRYFGDMVSRRHRQVFWQPSCSNANSYYFDKHGDVPLRPSTTLETYWRSRTFRLSDYRFERRAESVGAR
jgi:cation diffusion facilitator CzcD-associated flavoprotein CzcO